MPHHPSEEVAPDNLTDKIAQHSKDSNASDHPMHDENKGAIAQGDAEEARKGSVGPQIVDKMPEVEKSQDDLKAEAKELNK